MIDEALLFFITFLTLSKPIIRKDPITPDIHNKIIDMYGKDHSNLKNVRLCAMLLLGYAGFLRYSEIANLKMENINFFKLAETES
jgi:site-specific recombinase XerD